MRLNLAIQEHYRWNAYMICCGFVPAPISDLSEGRTKNYEYRFHGALTTFEGLIEYRNLLVRQALKKENSVGLGEAAANCDQLAVQKDLIKYDFQIMDCAWSLLNSHGLHISDLEGRNKHE